jgi:hypothetical protein
MGDMGEIFKEFREHKKEQRDKRWADNEKQIIKSGIPYRKTYTETCYLFREDGKPKVDFYPSTGRWRCNNRTYSGGAKAFLTWYKKQ